MIAAIAEKVNKDQRGPCLTTSFTPVQFKVTVTPALPEPPISFSSKISSWLQSNFFPFTFQRSIFCSRLNIPWKFVLKIKTVTSLRISHKRTKLHAFTALILKRSSLISNLRSAFWYFCCRFDRYDHYDQCTEGGFHIIATIATITEIELSDHCRCDRCRVVSIWSLRSLNLFFRRSQRSQRS